MEASLEMKSSGSNITWVLPLGQGVFSSYSTLTFQVIDRRFLETLSPVIKCHCGVVRMDCITWSLMARCSMPNGLITCTESAYRTRPASVWNVVILKSQKGRTSVKNVCKPSKEGIDYLACTGLNKLNFRPVAHKFSCPLA